MFRIARRLFKLKNEVLAGLRGFCLVRAESRAGDCGSDFSWKRVHIREIQDKHARAEIF